MKKNFNRVLSVLCAAFVACAMLIGSTAPVAAASSWDVYLNSYAFVGQPDSVYVANINTGAEAKVTSVKSSNSKIIKVVKDSWTDENGKKQTYYSLNYKKTGKAKLTIKFKTPSGTAKTIKKTIKVKKYPNEIKSLKVNGKSINISKNKYDYTKKYTGTKATIKLATKSGWKIDSAQIYLYNPEKNLEKKVKSPKTVLKKGTSISFPKKYTELYAWVSMSNENGEWISYTISLWR